MLMVRGGDAGLWPSLNKEQTATTVSSGPVRAANKNSSGHTMTIMILMMTILYTVKNPDMRLN